MCVPLGAGGRVRVCVGDGGGGGWSLGRVKMAQPRNIDCAASRTLPVQAVRLVLGDDLGDLAVGAVADVADHHDVVAVVRGVPVVVCWGGVGVGLCVVLEIRQDYFDWVVCWVGLGCVDGLGGNVVVCWMGLRLIRWCL